MKTRVRLDMVGTARNTTFVDTVHAGMQCADPLLQKPGVRGWNIERSVAGYDMPHSQPHLKMSSWHLNMRRSAEYYVLIDLQIDLHGSVELLMSPCS